MATGEDSRSRIQRRRRPDPVAVVEDSEEEEEYTSSDYDELPARNPARPSRKEAARSRRSRPASTTKNAQATTASMLRAIAFWTLDVLGRSLNHLKYPLSILLTLAIISVGLMLLWERATALVMPGVCALPVLSWSRMCRSVEAKAWQAQDFGKVFSMQSTLGEVQLISAQSSELPYAIKEGQLAMADIKLAIEYSKIPGKEKMTAHLNDFMDLTRVTVRNLIEYHVKTRYSVDFALGLNHWAKRSLLELESKNASPANRLWNSAAALIPGGGSTTMKSIEKIYLRYTNELRGEMAMLIGRGERVSSDLLTLEQQLNAVIGALGEEQARGAEAKDGLDTVWGMLFRRHREELRAVDRQLRFMAALADSVKRARRETDDTYHRLVSLNVEVEALHEALARPGAHLTLGDGDVGYCLSEIDTLIDSLQSGEKLVKGLLEEQRTKYWDSAATDALRDRISFE